MQDTGQQTLFTPVHWTEGERAIFRKREPLTPSQWSEKHVVVTSGPQPGPWRNKVTPYLTEIMDSTALPWVRKVIVDAAPQTGKTAAGYNVLAYRADRNPGPALVVMADENSVKRIYARRIEPMFQASAHLANLKSPNPRHFARSGIQLINGATIDLGWAGSASILASIPVEMVVLDETDKYPLLIGQETDPISLAEARTRTFPHTSLIFQISSPTTEAGFIWRALTACREIRAFSVPCPACGTLELMTFPQIRFPKDERDPVIIREDRLAWYECSHCHAKWTEVERDRAVRAGIWQPVAWDPDNRTWAPATPVPRPASIGYHVPAWLSPFVTFSECAAMFLEAQKDQAALRHFANSIEALPWMDWAVERHESKIMKLRDERPRGMVPPRTAALTATVDVQAEGFWYEVRAWGYGPEGTSWQIAEGPLNSWSAVEEIIHGSRYADAEGNAFQIAMTLIDSGDGKRTGEIYEWCRQHRGCFPSKGFQRRPRPWTATRLDAFPNGRPIPGGLLLYTIDTTHYKDRLASRLEVDPHDPGAWHLNADTTDNYARHMCAEFRDEHGVWQNPSGKRNDLWDCGVLQLALFDILRIAFLPDPEQQSTALKHKPKTQTRDWRTRPSWRR